jgi:hypothetical protein
MKSIRKGSPLGAVVGAVLGLSAGQQDAGVNWIIDGYNAQLGTLYSRTRATRMADQSRLVVALQLQY